MTGEERPGLLRLLWRGVTRRCPRCGGGRLFTRWVHLKEHCPSCGMRIERGEGFMLGVMAINIGVSAAVFTVYLVAGFALTWPDPPILPLTLAGIALCAVFPFVYYPYAKTLWAAIDYQMRPLDVVEEAEAMTFLAQQERSRAN